MLLRARDGKASVSLERVRSKGNEITLRCVFAGDFASAQIDEIAIDRARAQSFADRLVKLGGEPGVLQSARPGELVIAITPVPDSADLVVKATITRLRELGRMRASDMLTLCFEVAASDLPRLAREAAELSAAS